MEIVSPAPISGSPRLTARQLWVRIRQYENIIVFVGGFLFDVATIIRIDAWFDLAIQLGYLVAVTFLLLWQYKEHQGIWQPGPRFQKIWHYNLEALYFIYGGLFSNYVVLYFKSTSGAKTLAFFVLLTGLLFVNEMPQVRRLGYRLRMGFYAFCWASFLIYFVPIMIGRMGDWIFLLSMTLAFGLTWKVAKLLVSQGSHQHSAHLRLFWPAGAVLGIITLLYFLRLIPPVPLSVQYQGIFHGVEKRGGDFIVKSEKPPLYLFWRKDSRPFRFVEGEPIYYFVRIFAPARFHHNAKIRWERKTEPRGSYATQDLIPLQVTGGRDEGFRGYVAKAHFEPGRWRVSSETEDGRTIGTISFDVQKIEESDHRAWREIRM